MSIILGLHGGVTLGQHDPAACVAMDGKPVALCEEERYNRVKSSYGLMPEKSIHAALKAAGIKWGEVDLVVVPGITYADATERWTHYLRHHFGSVPRLERVHHQLAHAACAFYGSGLRNTHVLSLDASGDACAGAWGWVEGDRLQPHHFSYPQTQTSIGYFYTLMTQYCGFADGDEYKLMGLAPYATPNVDLSKVLQITNTGWHFDWSFVRDDPPCRSPFEPLYSRKLCALLGQPARQPHEPITPFYKNVAASTQAFFEQALCALAQDFRREKDFPQLVYAGGCALNSKANEKIREIFPDLYVSPVAGDRGLALGCAYLGAIEEGDTPQILSTPFLGTAYSDAEIAAELEANGIPYTADAYPEETAARMIAEGKVIGWFQGRSEAGARALGNRSILSNPRIGMRDHVNAKIKHREEFRPFAPAVTAEAAADWFDGGTPYMTITAPARHPMSMPSVVHIDGTSRVQTVSAEDNPRFHRLIENVGKRMDAPVVLNTSFNLRGQPIVESPRDAIATFYSCGLDALFMGSYYVEKTK